MSIVLNDGVDSPIARVCPVGVKWSAYH